MKTLLIQGVRMLDPAAGTDQTGALLVKDGRIEAVGPEFTEDRQDLRVLDGQGMVLAPGLIDMHVHLRDAGQKEADRIPPDCEPEDIETGCAAAAAGGFTAVACMPNTSPACDCPEVAAGILEKAKHAKARVYPVGAITAGLDGKTPANRRGLIAAGIRAFSDDGKPTENKELLQCLEEAWEAKLPVLCHCEDKGITGNGILHLGEVSRKLGVEGVHRASEDVSTAQAIALAEASGTAVHICHVSTAGSLAMIRDAKRRGVRVTCETAPHYFTLTHEKLRERDANFRMAPPLREESDRRAVLEAIADGTVDCIVTDHAPHTPADKADFIKAKNGIVGLETSLALCLTYLVKPGVISLLGLMKLMSAAPARILGVEGGSLREGAPADLVLFDPKRPWTVDKSRFFSKARNTPFDGWALQGKTCCTILGGELVYTDESI